MAGCTLWIGVLLSGCASTHEPATSAADPAGAEYGDCAGELDRDQRMELSAALQPAAEGRLHATLARLDTLPDDAVAVRYWRAEVQRRLGDPVARETLEELLDTCLSGRARHALGLLHGERGDLRRAHGYLGDARDLIPDSAAIRNDYGYTLLRLGQHEAARFEFRTALELGGADSHVLDNLMMALLAQERMDELAHLVNEYDIEPDRLRAVERDVAELLPRR